MRNKTVSYCDSDTCIINNGINEVTINISEKKFKGRAFDIINIMVDQVETHDEPKNEDDLEEKIIGRCIEALCDEVEKIGERELDFVYLWTLANILKDLTKKRGYVKTYEYSLDFQNNLMYLAKMGVKFRYV